MSDLSLIQLSLFGNNDENKPLPEIIADKNHFPLQLYDTDNGRVYAVQDWIKGIAQTDNPRRFWTDLKNRARKAGNELYARCVQLPYKATDGKKYQVDYADAEMLYLITQRMDTETGLRNKVLAYLAKAGVVIDEIRRNPETAAGMIDALETRHQQLREGGKAKRNMLTAAAKETHAQSRPDYVALTNAEYTVLFGAAKGELVRILGLDEKQASHFRDNISDLALQALDVSETTAAIRMRQIGRKLTTPEQITVVKDCCKIVAPGFKTIADYLRVDLLSGNALLTS